MTHRRRARSGASQAGTALVVVALTFVAAVVAHGSSAPPVESPHDRIACGECHTATPCTAADVTCTSGRCHAAVALMSPSSAHALLPRGAGFAWPACTACHGGHALRRGQDALRAACEARLDRACLRCHHVDSSQLDGGALGPGGGLAPRAATRNDVHSQALLTNGCATELSCFACHDPHGASSSADAGAPLNRAHVASTCGRCHPAEAKAYSNSVHGIAVKRGSTVAATCVSCHGGHEIRPARGPGSPTAAANVVYTCGRCHDDPNVTRQTHMSGTAVERYESTFHGVAYAHGIDDVATCVSCHGAHAITGVESPDSPVARAHIGATCGRCHARVTPAMIATVVPPGFIDRIAKLVAGLRVYFPLAGAAVNPLLVSGMGALVGFLSGLFGVGGGFLMTPLLIFIGIPAAVAAATDAAQISAGATSGAISHSRLGNVDFKMGLTIVVGGWTGGCVGVQLVRVLRNLGNFDFFLKLVYVLILGFIGATMLVEGIRALRGRSGSREPRPSRLTLFFARLPLQAHFPKSGLRTSVLLPVAAGFAVGVLAAFLGVGGGFIMLPAMIYIIGIPTRVAVGTDLFQIVLTSANVTLQQAITNHTVDLLLAVVLFAGSTIGAQFGVIASRFLKGEQIRVFLAVIVLVVMGLLLVQLLGTPSALVAFAKSGGGH
jgi:uncharacterized protein